MVCAGELGVVYLNLFSEGTTVLQFVQYKSWLLPHNILLRNHH